MIEKAVILSAGQGKRLLPLTEQRPKCLLTFNGRTLLEWQIMCLAENGIRDITVVTGFHADSVDTALQSRPRDGISVRTLFNPFFEVADNVGSCYLARDLMEQGPFMLINGDTIFHPYLLAKAIAQASGPVTVTIDRKDRYDADDMKVHFEGDRLMSIGKTLTTEEANGESIGMLFFSAEGGRMFTSELGRALHDAAGLKRWYLSVVHSLAQKGAVRVAQIVGEEWCEVDYPKDLTLANALTARFWREKTAMATGHVPPAQRGGVM